MSMQLVLRLENFSAGYGDTSIVQNCSFTLERGHAVGLLGLNGCGKTTLLKGICGLIRTSGSCLVQGMDPSKMGDRQRAMYISYIAQRGSIGFPISSLDVVLMGFNPALGLLEQPGKKHVDRALEALQGVGLCHRADADFAALSEGQRQLVTLARALVQNTPLLLFDEPDSALDFTNRHMVFDALQRMLAAEEKAAIFSMHDANFALRYCSRLLLMKKGRLVADLQVQRCEKKELEQALGLVYGPVALLEYGGYYVMVRRDCDDIGTAPVPVR